ncbi:MAG: DUF4174 domain-containing protein [Bryobacter sp.]|nr:DUF4174 domain-containing protein [Bryobacter sp.]
MPCPPPSAELQKLLAPYAWKNRVVLICAPASSAELKEQRRLFANAKDGLAERDLIVLERAGERFEVRLYGKDGGEKAQRKEPFPAEDLFGLIDQMPMRRQEMRREEIRRTKP